MTDLATDDALAEAMADALIDRLVRDPSNAHLRHRLLLAAGLPAGEPPSPPEPASQSQLAAAAGCSRETIRTIERRALLQLRLRLSK